MQKIAIEGITEKECLKLLKLELNVMALCGSVLEVGARIINYQSRNVRC